MISSPLLYALETLSRAQPHRAAPTEPKRFRIDPRNDVRLAEGRADLEGAFRTIYEAYLRSGLTTPNRYRMRMTRRQLLPTSDIVVVVERGQVACTTTLVGDSDLGLPLEELYPAEVAQRRAERRSIAEASCLAERTPAEGAASRVVLDAMQLMVQCAVRRGVSELLIAVHPRHATFYRRLGFRVIGEERTYGAVCDQPAVALALDLDLPWIAQNFPRMYRMFFVNWRSDEAYRRRSISPDLLAEYERILQDITQSERSANGSRSRSPARISVSTGMPSTMPGRRPDSFGFGGQNACLAFRRST
jgi:N-acyl-L-homoserine lactone synthetase